MKKEYFYGSAKLYNDQLVTIKDLEEFKRDLLISLARLIKDNSAKPNKKWIKSYELRQILKISKGTLHTLRCNGTLPYTKIGNIIYYDQDEINKVLTDKKRQYLKGMIPPKLRGTY